MSSDQFTFYPLVRLFHDEKLNVKIAWELSLSNLPEKKRGNKNLNWFYSLPQELGQIGLINPSHCVKSVRIRSYSGPYFPALYLRIQSKCGNVRTRITPIRTLYMQCHLKGSQPRQITHTQLPCNLNTQSFNMKQPTKRVEGELLHLLCVFKGHARWLIG